MSANNIQFHHKRKKISINYCFLELPGLKSEFELAMVNESLVFELLRSTAFWRNFRIYHENVCCVYALESPHRGDSNEYTQHTIIL